MAQHQVEVTGGVDTHKDTHTAAVIDSAGRVLGSAQFPASALGYRKLLTWLRSFAALYGEIGDQRVFPATSSRRMTISTRSPSS